MTVADGDSAPTRPPLWVGHPWFVTDSGGLDATFAVHPGALTATVRSHADLVVCWNSREFHRSRHAGAVTGMEEAEKVVSDMVRRGDVVRAPARASGARRSSHDRTLAGELRALDEDVCLIAARGDEAVAVTSGRLWSLADLERVIHPRGRR